MSNPQLIDSPIPDKADDCFKHDALASVIFRCLARPKPSEPTAIGIFGPWGCGKSGVLNLLRQRCEKSKEPKFEWVQFDAWTHQSEQMLVLAILHDLVQRGQNKAVESFKEIAIGTVLSFGHILLHHATGGAIKLEDVTKALDLADKRMLSTENNEKMIRDNFIRILAEARKRDNSRVVIAIDNLDRCRPEAALKVLESLYILSAVEGCTFVVAADQSVLVSFLDRAYEGTTFNGWKYLEKVFPDYFRVPDPYVTWEPGEGDHILTFLERALPTNGNWTAKDEEIVKLLWHYFAHTRVLRNPRRIKRILRRLVENELDPFDPEDEDDQWECMLFLVIVSDIWPEAYEFFLNADPKEWSDWVDTMSGLPGNPAMIGNAPDNPDLRAFFHSIRDWHGEGFHDCSIRDSSALWEYTDWLYRLGL
jgi:hypothetical protein